MFSRKFVRVVATMVVTALVSGCAEFDRRGGIVGEIEDAVLFSANTKSHRLFRSYLLIGVLMAAARQAGHNQTDAAAISGSLQQSLSIAFEGYECLYTYTADKVDWLKVATARPNSKSRTDTTLQIGTVDAITFNPPAICQFFDEKMARLDYSLYRLALSTLLNEKTSAQLTSIGDKLIGEIPAISPAAKSAIFGVRAINQTTSIVDDLLNLSFSTLGPVLTLLPLYRDSLEMNMWVIVDSLTRSCADTNPAKTVFAVLPQGAPPSPNYKVDCDAKNYALSILNNGNGDLRTWRDFVKQMNDNHAMIEAFAPHFALVSRLIWRSCTNLFIKEADCGDLFTKAMNNAAGEAIRVVGGNGSSRIYSASMRPPAQFAHPQLPDPKVIAAPGARDPESTGSVAAPKLPAAGPQTAAPPAAGSTSTTR